MNNAAKSGNRIVSKGKYVQVQLRKTWRLTRAAYLFICSSSAVGFCVWKWSYRFVHHTFSFGSGVAGIVLLGAGAAACYGSCHLFKQAHAMEAVVPLTRANTADLPAPDSLVRASQKPAQVQEAVLLRAATNVEEWHEEQLLRAATGEQA